MSKSFPDIAKLFGKLRQQRGSIVCGLCQHVLLTAAITLTAAIAPTVQAAAGDQEFALIVPKAASSTLIDVEFAGSRLVTVGERGHVLLSDDTGESWRQAKVPFRRMLTATAFVDANLGWAVGHQSMIFVTTDGGETWQRQLDGFRFQALVNEQNLVRTRKAYESLSGELEANPDDSRELELEDALFAFEDAEFLLEEPVVPTNLHDVWFLDKLTGWAVGSFGRLVETRDGGKSWTDQSHRVSTPEGFHLNGITGTSQGDIVIAGEGGVIFRSADAGRSWEQVDAGHYGTFFGVVYDPLHRRFTAFGLGSAVYQSTDRGLTWQSLRSPMEATFAGATVTSDGQTVLVGPAGAIVLIEGNEASLRAHPDPERKNQSAVVEVATGELLTVGSGGAKITRID